MQMFMCHSLNKGAEIQNAHFIVWSYISLFGVIYGKLKTEK